MTETKAVGLRFAARDGHRLQALADRCKAEGLHPESVTLFQNAADATREGVPLRVICGDPEEAVALADGFTLYGISRPAVEALRSK